MKAFLSLTPCLVATLITLTGCAGARKNLPSDPNAPPKRLEFTYAQLQLRDAEQIKRLIHNRVSKGDVLVDEEADDNVEAVSYYQDAVRILFSRPDQDGIRTSVFIDLRKRLADLQALDRVLQELTDESIAAIRSTDATPIEKATYVHLLENLMSEIKPELDENVNFKDLVTEIRDAKLVIDPEVASGNLMRSMDPLVSPSQTADLILKRKDQPKKPKKGRKG